MCWAASSPSSAHLSASQRSPPCAESCPSADDQDRERKMSSSDTDLEKPVLREIPIPGMPDGAPITSAESAQVRPGMHNIHHLPATIATVQWGYFDSTTKPVLQVRSGDYVEIECLCHHAGDAHDYVMDDVVREIY